MNGLLVKNLSIKRGGFTVCKDLNFEARLGEITVILGANGSGKSTFLDAIAGRVRSNGEIVFAGMTRKDLGYVMQGSKVFSDLSVLENLKVVGADKRETLSLFPALEKRLKTKAGDLSGGEQQMLGITLALARKPKLLIVDEPTLGLAPSLVDSVMRVIKDLAQAGIGIVLVDQYALKVLNIADRAYLMKNGEISMIREL